MRALAPPYPCAFVHVGRKRVFIERTLHAAAPPEVPGQGLRLASDGASLWLVAADGGALRVLAARCDGDDRPLGAPDFESRFGGRSVAVDH